MVLGAVTLGLSGKSRRRDSDDRFGQSLPVTSMGGSHDSWPLCLAVVVNRKLQNIIDPHRPQHERDKGSVQSAMQLAVSEPGSNTLPTSLHDTQYLQVAAFSLRYQDRP